MGQLLRCFARVAALACLLSSVAAAAPPPGSALPTTTVIADGVSTGTVRLTTVSVTGLYNLSTRAKIKGSGVEYILDAHQGTADGVNLVDASDGRQWVKVQSGGGAAAAHATTHEAGGADPIPLDTLAAPSDVTTLNASTSAHGLAPKRSGTATDCLLGNGTYAACLSGISIGAGTFLGNNGGSAGAPLALTPAQALALLQIHALDIVDSTTAGRLLLLAADATAQRLSLGLGSAALQASSAFDATGAAAAAQSASQPLDSDLTAVAALATTTFGRSLLTQADAPTARGTLGLGTAATSATSAFDAAGAATTAAAAAQAASQPLSALLTAFAGQSPLADRLTYWTGSGALAVTTYTSAARTFDAAVDAAAERTAMGLGTMSTQPASSVAITGGTIIASHRSAFPSSSVGGAAQVWVDWTQGDVQERVLSASLTGQLTFTAPTGLPSPGVASLGFRLKQASSGGPYTISGATMPTNSRWPNGYPVMPTGASSYIWITCKYDATVYDCQSAGNGGGFVQ